CPMKCAGTAPPTGTSAVGSLHAREVEFRTARGRPAFGRAESMDTRTAYLWGVTAGFAGTLLHAGANILDSYLSNRLSQRLSDLVAFSATTNLLFVPL